VTTSDSSVADVVVFIQNIFCGGILTPTQAFKV